MDYEKLIVKARKTIKHQERIEREMGLIAPGDWGSFDLLRTAFMAIRCGIETDDWDAVAEGQAMLEIILDKYKGELTATAEYINKIKDLKQ